MTPDFKKYLMTAGISSALLLSLIALLNCFVDPYDLLGNNRMGVFIWSERQTKKAILSYDHEAVLMGSSKTGYVNPDDLACYKFFNASIRAGVPEEIYFYLKAYLTDERLVIIALDFYMFNEREFPLKRISDWNDIQYSTVEYLLGAAITEASYKTIKKWLKNEKQLGMRPNGQFVYPGNPSTGDDGALPTEADRQRYQKVIDVLVSDHYGRYSFSEARLDYVRKIKTLLEAKEIPHAVLINPLNEDVLTVLKTIEAGKTFLVWKEKMRAIFPDLYDFSSSHYSARSCFYRDDPYHYTNRAGVDFLNEVICEFCTEKRMTEEKQ